jgi:hypothetical protein
MLDCGAVRRGRVVLAFYRRPKAVRGGGGYFRREAAGELARLLEVRSDSAATGDEIARAAAGQHVEGRVRPAVVSAASTRRCLPDVTARSNGGRPRSGWHR